MGGSFSTSAFPLELLLRILRTDSTDFKIKLKFTREVASPRPETPRAQPSQTLLVGSLDLQVLYQNEKTELEMIKFKMAKMQVSFRA